MAIMSIFSLLITSFYFMIKGDVVFPDLYLRQDYNAVVFWSGLVVLLGILAMIYNVGCVIYGGCTVWAWFLTIMVGLSTVMTIVGVARLNNLDTKDRIVQTVRVVQDKDPFY